MAKKYQVIRATTRPIDGVEAGGKTMNFGKSGGFMVSDASVANDIEQQYGNGGRAGGDVVVIPDDTRQDRTHKYFFGAWPEMPWKKGKDGKH